MSSPMKWMPAPLSKVRVTDEYCTNAFSKERWYLLSFRRDDLLAGFYNNAGIGKHHILCEGWEGTLIGGHTLGHYLSALSLAYSASGDEALLKRLGEMLAGLSLCQDKVGSGLIWGALPLEEGIEAQFDNVEAGKTDIEHSAWVPWYTLHKLLAGLVEAAKLGGTVGAQALSIARKLGDWVVTRTSRWDEHTRKRVLAVEYGGMNDALYALYALTHEERYAIAAHVFDEDELFEGMLEGRRNFLEGKHANTTIPKFLGALSRYIILQGETIGGARVDAERYLRAAEAFFDAVVSHHTYVTGGNSEWEHFGKDDILNATRSSCNCETCNVYNMMKLARGLFSVTGDVKYLDFYDNAFTNSILSSQNPETGMTTYFQPMAGGAFKVFAEPYSRFWCCTGTGMENFSKLGDAIFFLQEDKIAIARYLSSSLELEDGKIEVEADLPMQSDVVIRIGGTLARTLVLRIPDWCQGASLDLNGTPVPFAGRSAEAEVRGSDMLCLHLAIGFTLHGLPDADDVFAFKYGNAVLSADLGQEEMDEARTGVDVKIPARCIIPTERLYFKDRQDVLAHPENYFQREGENFILQGADIPLTFGLHYKRYRERYAIYYHICDGERVPDKELRKRLDVVHPACEPSEMNALHAMREKNTMIETENGPCRFARGRGYFSYDMRVDPTAKNTLCFTIGVLGLTNTLRIFGEGIEFFEESLPVEQVEKFYKREIAIPAAVLARARTKTVGGRIETVIRFTFTGDPYSCSGALYSPIAIYAEK